MKTLWTKLTVAIISFAALAAVATLSVEGARRAERYQAAAISNPQPGPEYFETGYSALMNNLFH